MRASALALALAAALLAGCGGHSKAAKPNGEASKPADRVFADAKAAATRAKSTHVSGSVKSDEGPITLNISMSRSNNAKGSLTTNGLAFDLIRIGDTAYIRGSDAFYKHFAGAAIAQLIHGRWIKASVAQGRFKSLGPLTNIGLLFSLVSSHHGKLANDGKTTFKGQQVVGVRDTADNSKLYVAAIGTPYPVAIVSTQAGKSGTVTFSDWNANVSPSAPDNAIDISQLGG
jgi:hypothetical protein